MADTINNIKKLETFLIVAAITLGKGLSSLSTIYDTWSQYTSTILSQSTHKDLA